MKSILVPMEATDTMVATLQTALLLAQRCDAYIESFALRFAISELIAVDPEGTIPLESFHQDRLQDAAAARRQFEAFMQQHQVAPAQGAAGALSYGWLDEAPEGDGFVGNYGRVFDLTVLGRPGAEATGLHRRAIESAMFESGRPVLLAPPAAPTRIATNIMIHWNASTEQSTTTAFAMPLLRQADRVTVLEVVGGQGVPGPAAGLLVNNLKRNGIDAKLVSVPLEGRTTGVAVLAAAKADGSDLLVKGAYTQSRLRQMIFGGTTSHILANASLPVLMAR
jgi:nucleotide-binding universal stress UspA family protein